MPPGENAFRPIGAEKLPADKIGQDLAGEDLGQPRVCDPGDFMEETGLVHASLGHQEMEVRVKIDAVSESLNGRNDARDKIFTRQDLEVNRQGVDGTPAKIPQQPALVLEEDPQPLGDGEDDLAMGNIQKERLPHPLAPFLKPFGMARRAESPGAAGEHEEPLLATIRTSYAGKSAL